MRSGAALAAAAGGAVGAGAVAYSLLYRPAHDRQLVFGRLSEAMAEVERLAAGAAAPLDTATAWSWSETLAHCAQSIEFSMQGFPKPKPAWFQDTLGAAAFAAFAWRGRMSHNLAEPIPGAPALNASAPAAQSLARLRQAVADFGAHTGPLQPHFAYGALHRAQYEQAHAMHLANHLSAFEVAQVLLPN
ncbi:DUF1569 domain-containing protein [Paracidovorax sp. MALMAid1276]|uniref:DUF1569 domain-containing protein n=1 Tax=Paracidovorax sp. MALMAid1276 TaxID=3411631 RepID=UPI003B9D7729